MSTGSQPLKQVFLCVRSPKIFHVNDSLLFRNPLPENFFPYTKALSSSRTCICLWFTRPKHGSRSKSVHNATIDNSKLIVLIYNRCLIWISNMNFHIFTCSMQQYMSLGIPWKILHLWEHFSPPFYSWSLICGRPHFYDCNVVTMIRLSLISIEFFFLLCCIL